MRKFLHKNLAGYAFLAPWLLGFLLLTIGPILASLYLSFTKYNVTSPPRWIGLANYAYMFQHDDRFRKALEVTFNFVLVSVPAKLIFALAVAMTLDKGVRAIGVYRALFYLPSILGGSIAVAILWRQLFNYDGVVNDVLHLFGVQGPYWLADPNVSLWTLIVLSVWQFGSPMLIFLAGLRAIPQELYEAAQIDAAGPVRRFFAITVPLLAPVIFFNLVLQMIDAFKSFSGAFIISGGSGAPLDSLLFFSVYLFSEAFAFLRMGYASALAWVLMLVIASFTAIAFWTSKYWVHYEGGR
jgi:multiple sugar transport system permease protein